MPSYLFSIIRNDLQVLLASLVSREKRARWAREGLEVLEVWLDPQALPEKEADLGETGREVCLVRLAQRVSLDYRDCLVWWEPKGTGDTREILVRRVMKDPEG